MTKFYTSVLKRGNHILRRGYEKGLRVTDKVPYSPYVFIPKENGKYRTIDGKPVEKLQFDTLSEATDFIKRYEDVSNMEIYGLTIFQYLYIFDEYKGDIDYDPKMVKVGILDIECAADDGFPDIQRADKPLTAITIRCRGRNYVFGCGEFHSRDDNTYYINCKDERELVAKFIDCWVKLDLDIVTGWNIEFFDIPYLVNRIKILFDDSMVKKLSPWRTVDEKFVEFRGKSNQSYNILGIAALDYYQLYRKFSYSNQESYKLDYICQVELGEKKIDYSEYGNLLELYKKNHQKFIEYNIHDTVLVDRLDEKMKFLEQVMAMTYDAKVNYDDTMTTVRSWDVIIHNYLLERGIVIPRGKKNEMTESLVGGYVKEPKIGLSNWVVSFDLNSLYPHLIMQYNISPETFDGRIGPSFGVDWLLDGNFEYRNSGHEYAYAANGCVYKKDKQGFLPALMEKMYNDRTKYKKLMLEAKQRYENNKNSDDEKLIARYHNMQMAKKIQLNSAYGALGNQYFRWFNFDHAEAITMSGQLSIRWIEKKMNLFMNKLLNNHNIKDIDFVIASDTDSIYVEMDRLVTHLGTDDELKIVAAIDKFCEQKIQPYLDNCFEELAAYMNAYQQKMQMKRETIANKGIWRGKKMYILNAWNVEGVQYSEPKLKLQGIEAVRSSTPHACRENIKKALGIILNGDQEQLIKFIEEFRSEFLTLPFQDVSFPRSVKHMKKYTKTKGQLYDKGTPIHVKAAIIFNDLLKKHNITNIQPISDGDKIRFAYLKMPNIIGDTVIGAPDTIPEEFGVDPYIDRELQFTKSFLDPVNSIASIIGWKTENIATLEDFFG
jgi:DNA polymerase elongation subunit (family B)